MLFCDPKSRQVPGCRGKFHLPAPSQTVEHEVDGGSEGVEVERVFLVQILLRKAAGGACNVLKSGHIPPLEGCTWGQIQGPP